MTSVATLSADLQLNSAAFRSGMLQAAQSANETFAQIRAQAEATAQTFEDLKSAAIGIGAFEALREGAEELFAAQAAGQKVVAQLNAAILSTGGAAGQSAEDLEALAMQLEGVSNYGHVAIESAEALLLTFTKIGGGVLPEATKAVLDMSTALGTDLTETARQVGKALEDPEAGMTRLQRVGVLFTADQKATIKALQDTGDMAGAQTIILKQLEVQFGGSAAAAKDTLGGALAELKNRFDDLLEDKSTGLFSDALTVGLKTAANNLDLLVGAATVGAAVIGARLAGAAIAAAAGMIADAQATALDTAATVANAEAKVLSTARRAVEIDQRKALAAETIANAIAEDGEAVSAKALDLALAAYNKTAAQSAAANGAYRASLLALTEAQAANAGATAVAAKGIGSFALGLVGGPWGLAALAIGAVGYAFLSIAEDAKQAEEATQKEILAISQVPDHIREVTAAYTALNSTDSSANFVKQWVMAQSEIAATEEKIEQLNKQLSVMKADQANPNIMQTDEATAQIAKLEQEIRQLTVGMNAAKGAIAPTTAEIVKMGPAADEVRQHLQQLDDQDLSHLESSLGAFFSWFAGQSAGAVAHTEALRSAFSTDMDQLGQKAAALQAKIQDFGKTPAIAEQNAINRMVSALKASGASSDEINKDVAALNAMGASVVGLTAKETALEASKKKAAPDKEAEQYKQVTDQIKDQIAASQALIAGTGNQTAADKLATKIEADLADGKLKLTAADQARVKALLDVAVADGKAAALAVQQREDLKQQIDLQQKVNDLLRQQALDNQAALNAIGHGQQWNDEHAALLKIQDDYQKLADEAKKAYDDEIAGGKDAATALDSYNKKIAEISTAYQQADTAAKKSFADQTVAMADWHNGAIQALEDYETQAKNVAANTAAAMNSAFGSIEDDLVTLVGTGKLDFASLATSIIEDFARIEIKQLLAPAFDWIGQLIGLSKGGDTASQLSGAGTQLIIASTGLDTSAANLLTAAYALQAANSSGGVSGSSASLAGDDSIDSGIDGGVASWFGYAHGAAFNAGRVTPFANGGIFDTPTIFPMANGMGLMGEAGPETVIPLKRGSDGKLGIGFNGGQTGSQSKGGDQFNTTIQIVMQSNGTTQTKSNQSDNQDARQLAQLMEAAATKVVIRATQPGGIIYNRQKSNR